MNHKDTPVTVTSIPAPIIGSFLQSFLDAHRADPWPYRADRNLPWNVSVRAGLLHETYVTEAQAVGLTQWSGHRRVGDSEEPILSLRDFGLAVASAGFRKDRDEEGNRYWGISEVTRRDLAHETVYSAVLLKLSRPLYTEAEARHRAEFDHGTSRVLLIHGEEPSRDERGNPLPYKEKPNPCMCDISDVTRPAFASYVEEHRAEIEAQVESFVERIYGPFLNWSAGDPNPAQPDEDALSAIDLW